MDGFLNLNFADPNLWIGFLTLTLLEIVLGVDNVVFISILAAKLPVEQQAKARKLGLSLALITRILLLLTISWIAGLTKPLFQVIGHPVAGRDLILGLGGLFLIWKATREIHDKLEGEEGHASAKVAPTFASVIIQILLLDIVFSLDSVITAVGMVNQVPVMIAAVVIALGFMLIFAGYISSFIERHPTLKMLALSFLILIGVTLVAESFHREIPKGYIYFAMAFSVGVEILNINLRKKATKPVHLHERYVPEGDQKKGAK
jgi:predicted tellurium resistance membrane protein TerC